MKKRLKPAGILPLRPKPDPDISPDENPFRTSIKSMAHGHFPNHPLPA
jgi:hypothetical protein